ncbi:MAG: alpha/beta fold hydrolase [Vicinamibacterales bacterium]
MSLTTACARAVHDAPLRPLPGGHGGGYRLIGRGPRLLVVLPGIVGPADALAALGEALADDYQTCLVHYPAAPSLDALLAALDAVRREHGVGPAAVCGGSFGALVAQAWLARDPAALSDLVISGAGPPDPARAARNARLLPWMARLPIPLWRLLLRGAVRGATTRTPERASWRRFYGEAIAGLTWADLESRYHIAIGVDRGGPPSAAALAAWRGRLLVIEGGRDGVAGDRVRAALAEVYPAARFHRIDDAGHGLALDQPEAWLRVTTAFLRSR